MGPRPITILLCHPVGPVFFPRLQFMHLIARCWVRYTGPPPGSKAKPPQLSKYHPPVLLPRHCLPFRQGIAVFFNPSSSLPPQRPQVLGFFDCDLTFGLLHSFFPPWLFLLQVTPDPHFPLIRSSSWCKSTRGQLLSCLFPLLRLPCSQTRFLWSMDMDRSAELWAIS